MRSHTLCIFPRDTSHLKNLRNSLLSQIWNTKMHLDEAQKAEVLTALNVSFLSEAASPRAETAELHGSSPVSYQFTALRMKATRPWFWIVPWVVLISASSTVKAGTAPSERWFPSSHRQEKPFQQLIPLMLPGLPHCIFSDKQFTL